MSNVVQWLLELSIKPGKLEDFKSVMADMVAATKKEEGTLIYEWYFNDENTVCNIYERYADSAAVLVHADGFGEFAERFMDAVDPVKFTVMGDPSPEAREALAGLSPIIFGYQTGFAR